MTDETTTKPKRPRRKLKYVILGAALLAGFLFALKLNAPSRGTIVAHPEPLPKSKLHQASEPDPSQQISTYYSLSLPAGYVKLADSNPAQGILYSQSYTKQLALGHLIVTIAIKPLPEGGLQSDSNFQLRASQSGRFTISQQAINGETVTIANDTQSTAVVAFWPHGNYLATISLTLGYDGPPSDGNDSELNALKSILQGWQWQ